MRGVFPRIVSVLTACLAVAALNGADGADLSSVEWPKVLPQTELTKLVDESTKVLQEATRSSQNFNLKAKNAEGEAYVLVLYAQAGIKSGNSELARKSAVLRDAALAFAEAAKKKNFDNAKAQAETIAKFKNMKPEGDVKMDDVPLDKAIPIKSLMDQVNTANKEMIKYNRLTPAAFNAKGKAEEIALAAHKMAALTVAITAHVPEKDQDAKKTRKVWLESSEEVRQATLEMAAAAKVKKQADVKTAFRKMDAACTRCHDVYRVEVD